MMNITLLALASIGAMLAAYVLYKRISLHGVISNVTTCGYVAPSPTLQNTAKLLSFARTLTNIQVGKITYIGRHNLDSLRGPRIICANHPHWADAAIMPQLIGGPARYMAHGRVMTFFGGLLGVYLAKRGAFAANDAIRDTGIRTRAAAAEMVCRNDTLVVLPEGLTNFSPEMGVFKNGTVMIARAAADKLGKPVWLVPSYIRYGRYPGPWLAKFDRALQFFLVFLAFPIFRRGAVVVVGEPISTDQLFKKSDGTIRSDDEATALLKTSIAALDPGKV